MDSERQTVTKERAMSTAKHDSARHAVAGVAACIGVLLA
jgi:hypothetical protein